MVHEVSMYGGPGAGGCDLRRLVVGAPPAGNGFIPYTERDQMVRVAQRWSSDTGASGLRNVRMDPTASRVNPPHQRSRCRRPVARPYPNRLKPTIRCRTSSGVSDHSARIALRRWTCGGPRARRSRSSAAGALNVRDVRYDDRRLRRSHADPQGPTSRIRGIGDWVGRFTCNTFRVRDGTLIEY